MWVEPDLNLPDGESLVRQLLVGQRYFKEQYGVTARIGWNPDSFGYQLAASADLQALRDGLLRHPEDALERHQPAALPALLVGVARRLKVLTYFPTDYTHGDVNPTRLSFDFAESAQRNPGTTEMLDLYGVGDHGGGPTRAMLDQADHWICSRKGR